MSETDCLQSVHCHEELRGAPPVLTGWILPGQTMHHFCWIPFWVAARAWAWRAAPVIWHIARRWIARETPACEHGCPMLRDWNICCCRRATPRGPACRAAEESAAKASALIRAPILCGLCDRPDDSLRGLSVYQTPVLLKTCKQRLARRWLCSPAGQNVRSFTVQNDRGRFYAEVQGAL